MYKNKAKDGTNNICGQQIRDIRIAKHPKMSQNDLAKKLCELGLEVNKNAIQRIESGERFVTDIELKYLASALEVSYIALLGIQEDETTEEAEETEE